FEPNLVTTGMLAEAFWIFIDTDECHTVYSPKGRDTIQDTLTTVYTDGSAIRCGTDEASAGAGIFYGEQDVRNRSIHLPNEVGRMNQVSELVGAKSAVEDVPINTGLELVSDSQHVLDGLRGHFVRWEDEGYLLISNSLITQVTIARFHAHTAPTWLQ
ncbi:hypothetical protein ARMGADRAFT_942332, partial [Armillaria gallica]